MSQNINTSIKTISVVDFCRMSGLGKTTAYKLIRTKQLKSTLVGNRRLISLASAEALINPPDDASIEANNTPSDKRRGE